MAVMVFQPKRLKRRNLKKFRLERESNPWPLRYRCSALTNWSWAIKPTGSWSSESIYPEDGKININIWNNHSALERCTGIPRVMGSIPVQAWIRSVFVFSTVYVETPSLRWSSYNSIIIRSSNIRLFHILMFVTNFVSSVIVLWIKLTFKVRQICQWP